MRRGIPSRRARRELGGGFLDDEECSSLVGVPRSPRSPACFYYTTMLLGAPAVRGEVRANAESECWRPT